MTGAVLGGFRGMLEGLVGGAAAGAIFGAVGGGLAGLAIVTTYVWPFVAWTGFWLGYGFGTSIRALGSPDPRVQLVGGIGLVVSIVAGAYLARGVSYLNAGRVQQTPYIYQEADGGILEDGGLPNGKYNFVVRMDRSIRYSEEGSLNGHGDLAGGEPVLSAGEMRISGGKVAYINPKSGTYLPSEKSLWIAEMILRYKGLWGERSSRLPVPTDFN